MPHIETYSCFLGINNSVPVDIVDINLMVGDGEPVQLSSSLDYKFYFEEDGLNKAIAATNGYFDPKTTFIFSASSNSSIDHEDVLRGLGFEHPLMITSAKDLILTFSNGHRIVLDASNTYAVSYNISRPYGQSDRTRSQLTSTSYDLTGLISDTVYSYEYVSSNEIRMYTGLCAPKITVSPTSSKPYFTLTRSNNFFPSRVVGTGGLSYGYLTTSEESTRSDAENTFAFFHDFWNGIDNDIRLKYHGTMLIDSGGTVTPDHFFASKNEPRMFTVTPDQHHAIHSVTIRSLDDSMRTIPYRESAMNLLTGAKSYMFTMPDSHVQITISFRSLELSIPVTVKYTSPDSGRLYTTSFNLLYDSPREEETEGENQNEP